jgi:hypothetical protein
MIQFFEAWSKTWSRIYNPFFHPRHLYCPFEACNPADGPQDPEDLELSILKMKSLLQKVMGGGVAEELIQFLSKTAQRSDEINKVVIVWVNLIEALVQHAEESYGTGKNNGKLKAAYVKEVIKELLHSAKFEIPNINKYFVPIILDGLVDWVIDTIVNATNKYGLWETSNPAPNSLWASSLIIFQKVLGYITRFLLFAARPFIFLFQKLRPKLPLSPLVKKALDAVKEQGLIANNDQFLKGVIETFIWIGKHRDQLVAASELIFETIQITERFVTASGPQKKAYAVRIIMAVLTDYGYVNKGGLTYNFLEAFLDVSIDVAVFLFNKRKVFAH